MFSPSLGTIPASFFSSKTEKKLSFELSALKTELGLCQAEMEAERQTHQKEEQGLRARVVEAKKPRDAAIQEALKNSEAMKNLEAVKKECNGIASSFVSFCSQTSFLLTCCLVPCSALRVEK